MVEAALDLAPFAYLLDELPPKKAYDIASDISK